MVNGSMIHQEDKGKHCWVDGLNLWAQCGDDHRTFLTSLLVPLGCKPWVHSSCCPGTPEKKWGRG